MIGTVVEHFELLEQRRTDGELLYYKAHDSRLNRSTMVMVFPGGVTREHLDQKLRFMEEAFLACSQDSPYILPVVAFLSEGPHEWVVSEYHRGRTLDRWLARHRITRDRAVRFANQMAEALEAAHSIGLVHGDLRPEHVLIPESGPNRVFNFGLYHIRPAVTSDGAWYQAPECLAGLPPTPRSDLFSLGCILYEMISGSRAFSNGSSPVPLLSAVPDIEPRLAALVDNCLKRDPAHRTITLAEIRYELEHWRPAATSRMVIQPVPEVAPAQPEPAVAAPEVKAETSGKVVRKRRKRKHKVEGRPHHRYSKLRSYGLAALGILAAIGLLGLGISWLAPTFGGGVRATGQAQALSQDPGWTLDPSLSADGRFLVYSSDRAGTGVLDLYLQDLTNGRITRVVQDLDDKTEPSIAADGSLLVYRSEQDGGGIYALNLTDKSSPRLLAPSGRRPRISPRRDMVAYFELENDLSNIGHAHVMQLAGGAIQPIAPDLASSEAPIWSPDGLRLMFVGRRQPADAPELYVTTLLGGTPVSTGLYARMAQYGIKAGRPSAWLELPDRLVLTGLQNGRARIFEVEFSPVDWHATAAPVQISPGLDTETAPAALSSGLMVFARTTNRISTWRLPFSHDDLKPRSEAVRLTEPGVLSLDPAVNREKTHLLTVANRSGRPDVWTRDLTSGVELHLTAAVSRPVHPVSAGGRVLFGMMEKGVSSIFQVGLTGGAVNPVCPGCGLTVWDMTPDGNRFLYEKQEAGRGHVEEFDFDKNRSSVVLEGGDEDVVQASWSPNGEWLLFLTTVPHGRTRLWVTRYRGGVVHPRKDWIPITPGMNWDGRPHWAPDGNAIYFFSLRDQSRCIWTQRLDPETKAAQGDPFPVYHSHRRRVSLRNTDVPEQELAVTPDALLFNQGEHLGNLWIVDAKKSSPSPSTGAPQTSGGTKQ